VAGIQSISATGELAVLLDCELDWGVCHNGTLASVPLVGGTPREIMENVFEADWSPNGKDLAIVRVFEGQYRLEYPIGTVLYKAPGWIEHMRVSPKGDLVAFIDHPVLAEVSGSVMVADLTGKTQTLSAGWVTAKGLAWSPAGDEVWFSAGKTRMEEIHAVTLSGRERLVFHGMGTVVLHDISHDGRVLVGVGTPRSRMISSMAGSEKERELSWFDWSTSADLSKDGKNLLFYEWGRAASGSPLVYLRKMDGSNDPVRLGEGKALALSPDGKSALVLREGPPPQLVLLTTGAGEPRLLPRGNISEYHYAAWFPDGQQILFTGLESGHALRSYVQNVSNGQVRPVTDEGMIALFISPDAKSVVGWAPDKGPDGKYYRCPLDGTAPIPISGIGLGEVPIQWSADSRTLYTREGGEVDAAIYRMDFSSGRRELVKKITPDPVGLIGLEVRPGGIQITPDGRSYVYTYWTALQDLFLIEGLK
jgi:Tol biopolymer transport system component